MEKIIEAISGAGVGIFLFLFSITSLAAGTLEFAGVVQFSKPFSVSGESMWVYTIVPFVGVVYWLVLRFFPWVTDLISGMIENRKKRRALIKKSIKQDELEKNKILRNMNDLDPAAYHHLTELIEEDLFENCGGEISYGFLMRNWDPERETQPYYEVMEILKDYGFTVVRNKYNTPIVQGRQSPQNQKYYVSRYFSLAKIEIAEWLLEDIEYLLSEHPEAADEGYQQTRNMLAEKIASWKKEKGQRWSLASVVLCR